MLDYARRAHRLGAGKPADEIRSDELLSLAIPRALEIIGEAASRILRSEQARHSTIPWDDIIGMRHRMAHDRIAFSVVERVIQDDLPPLIETLEAILAEGERPPG